MVLYGTVPPFYDPEIPIDCMYVQLFSHMFSFWCWWEPLHHLRCEMRVCLCWSSFSHWRGTGIAHEFPLFEDWFTENDGSARHFQGFFANSDWLFRTPRRERLEEAKRVASDKSLMYMVPGTSEIVWCFFDGVLVQNFQGMAKLMEWFCWLIGVVFRFSHGRRLESSRCRELPNTTAPHKSHHIRFMPSNVGHMLNDRPCGFIPSFGNWTSPNLFPVVDWIPMDWWIPETSLDFNVLWISCCDV